MDTITKKSVMRMIPYGLYVLTANAGDGRLAAATVNWVSQVSFEPPLVAVGVRVDSFIHQVLQDADHFALNILGKGQQGTGIHLFKPAEHKGQTINGEPYYAGITGAPVLQNPPAFLECKLFKIIPLGDHSIFVGEVIEAGLKIKLEGRPEESTLWLKELGEKIFYGG